MHITKITVSESEEKEIWSTCKCGEEKEGEPDVHDICPACKRIGCFILDDEVNNGKSN